MLVWKHANSRSDLVALSELQRLKAHAIASESCQGSIGDPKALAEVQRQKATARLCQDLYRCISDLPHTFLVSRCTTTMPVARTHSLALGNVQLGQCGVASGKSQDTTVGDGRHCGNVQRAQRRAFVDHC